MAGFQLCRTETVKGFSETLFRSANPPRGQSLESLQTLGSCQSVRNSRPAYCLPATRSSMVPASLGLLLKQHVVAQEQTLGDRGSPTRGRPAQSCFFRIWNFFWPMIFFLSQDKSQGGRRAGAEAERRSHRRSPSL